MKLEIHPAADVWPMLNADDLAELAESIKTHGLIDAIKVKDGVIIDGRNRLIAGEMAEVEPRFEEVNGEDDLESYIVSLAKNRRHLTKGQLAMGVAMTWPEPEKGGRGQRKGPTELGVTREYVRQARAVLRDSRDKAEDVLVGAKTLSEAYADLHKTKAPTAAELLAGLREICPDLAERVENGELNMHEAAIEAKDRDVKAESLRKSCCRALAEAARVRSFRSAAFRSAALALIADPQHNAMLTSYFQHGIEDLVEDKDAILEGCAGFVQLIAAIEKMSADK